MTTGANRFAKSPGLLAIISLLTALLAVTGLGFGKVAVDALPDLPDLPVDIDKIDDLAEAIDQRISTPSVVKAGDGSVIGRFSSDAQREPIPLGGVPQQLETVLLTAEDREFRSHPGFDLTGIIRAAVTNARGGSVSEGGSTITQQLAKNLFTTGERTLSRKLEELRIAIKLEDRFSKDEILTAYANSVYLGGQAFGFEAAADTYFRKSVDELTLSETALLVGVLPAPSDYDPRRRPEVAEQQRQRVLDQLEEVGAFSDEEIGSARSARPEIQPPKPQVEQFPYYLDYVRRHLLTNTDLEPADLFGGGLEILTALDPDIQNAAIYALNSRLDDPDDPSGAVVVVEPNFGLVRALVGGKSFEASRVNLALGRSGGGSGRQTGSAFKSFVLATAFEQGHSPNDLVIAPRAYVPEHGSGDNPVRNFSDTDYGRVTLSVATRKSINTAFVALTDEVGPDAVADTARSLGITGLPESVGSSIGIGAYESSPLEMAGAYAAFANGGKVVTPTPVIAIKDRNGEELDIGDVGGVGDRALDEETASLISEVLASNVERGTATRADFGRPAAAKTGTSDNYANAWLVGYTPQVSTAVWMGDPAGNVSMRNVSGFSRVTGGSVPAQIWQVGS